MTDLAALADLDVDAVRADVARLEQALAIGRAILAVLEPTDPDVAPAPGDADAGLWFGIGRESTPGPATVSTRFYPVAEDEDDAVRPAEEPSEAPRAEPAPDAAHSSQPAAPAPASTPTGSPPEEQTLSARARRYLRDRPGQWFSVREVHEALGGDQAGARSTVSNALRAEVTAGTFEHNGESTNAARYRCPPVQGPAPMTARDHAELERATAPEPASEHPAEGLEPQTGEDDVEPAGDLAAADVAVNLADTRDDDPNPVTPRRSALAGPPMPKPSAGLGPVPAGAKPRDGVSRKTARALAAEQRDGPLAAERNLSTLEREVLRWLGRNGSGTSAEISRSMIRSHRDVALALTTIEQHHSHLIERRERAGGAIRYGLTHAGVKEFHA